MAINQAIFIVLLELRLGRTYSCEFHEFQNLVPLMHLLLYLVAYRQ